VRKIYGSWTLFEHSALFFIYVFKRRGLAVNPINQSTATKGNLEGIFGVIFLLG
jgi:hypothetical protein